MRNTITILILSILLFSCSNETLLNNDTTTELNSGTTRSIEYHPGSTGQTEYRISPYKSKDFTISQEAISGGKSVFLTLNAILDFYTLGGHNYSMKIMVNNTVLDVYDLVNKPQIRYYVGPRKYQFTYTNGVRGNWWNDSNKSFTLFYADNYTRNDAPGNRTHSRYGVVGGEATTYELNITPYLKASGNNIIRITNTNPTYSMRIKGLQIWKQILNNTSFKLNSGKSNIIKVNTSNNKSYALRLFGKLDYSVLAGHANVMKIEANSSNNINYKFTKEDVINKGWRFYKNNPILVYDFMAGQSWWNCFDANNNFLLCYSPNFFENNISSSMYGVSSEAYQYDFKIPSTLSNTIFDLKITNVGSVVPASIRDLSIFEITNY